MTPGGVARRFIGVVLVVFALVALGLAAGSADASMSVALDYGGDAAAYDDTCHVASGLGAGRPAAVCGDAAAVHRGEIASSPGHPRAGQQFRPGRSRVAPIGTLSTKIPTEGRKFNQLQTRGWDQSSIDELVNGPVHTSPAVNRASGNPATAYFDDAGGYVVRDDLTGDLVQMSDRFDPDWIPDSSIVDPYGGS